MVVYLIMRLKAALGEKDGKGPLSKDEEDKEYTRLLGIEPIDRLRTMQELLTNAVKDNMRPIIIVDGLQNISLEERTVKVRRDF